jgi:chemotaxis protein CheD
MEEVIYVNTGEAKVSEGEAILRAIAIGSCIVVAALDSKQKVGAMAHVMLPGKAPQQFLEKTKYAFDAIEKMLDQMLEAGSNVDDIEVCLVGAGNVLEKENDTICDANIESVTSILKEKGICIKASVLGGTERKGVVLDTETGSISYTEGDEKEKTLWQISRRK